MDRIAAMAFDRLVANGTTDVLGINNMRGLYREMTANISSFAGRGATLASADEPDSRRDIYDECGFPNIVQPQLYQRLYDREAIAARAVEVVAKEAWQVSPTVFEDEDAEVETKFEREWFELAQHLEQSTLGNWHAQEESTTIWETLQRADILSGIGRYGVILLGLDDGKELNEPVDGIVENGSVPAEKREAANSPPEYTFTHNQSTRHNLLFMRPFSEPQAQVTQWETNTRSPRFGQPVQYLITLHENRDQYGVGAPVSTKSVHWTRIVHLADTYHTACSSEILAVPRMQPILNHLLNLRKIYHPSAEGYWKSIFAILALSTQPQLAGDVDVDEESMRDVMEHIFNGMQRHLFLRGMDAKNIAPAMTNPEPYIAQQIEAICIKLGIPIRVFKGSERGELASSQDDAAWNDRLRQRQTVYMTPKIVARFVNHLIFLGVLSQPSRFMVDWADLTSQTDAEKATVAEIRTKAIVAYSTSDAPMLIQPLDFWSRIIGMSEEEAATIVENSGAAMRESVGEGEGDEPEEPEEIETVETEEGEGNED